MSAIPYGRQYVSQGDIDAVVAVLNSDFLTQGPVVPAFENAVAKYCNAQYAVAANSATSALHLACLALGVGKGDVVWTSPITFVASANCALYCGATVDFVDIEPRTYNLSVEGLAEKLAIAKEAGKLPKVIIPVHLCGQSCEMEAIHKLSRQYGFKIIEDASHAIGGKYKNEYIGNCRFSDITVFSFHPVKIITTGEGGMAVTNDAILAKHMRIVRGHGITSCLSDMQPRPLNEIWNYQQIDLGFNYRMTELQAALGLSQMQRLDSLVEKRHLIAQRYDNELGGLPIETPWQHPDNYSAYHLYPIRIARGKSAIKQRQLYDALQAEAINCNLHYIPIYRQPYYQAMGFNMGYCAEAEQYYKEALSIPMFPTLTDGEQGKVIRVIHEALA
jgi:UDP-4-amino-4,6-dideoxy-N-acetyl-beta-L-altrosamine transaminase